MCTNIHPSSRAALRRAFHADDHEKAALLALALARKGVPRVDLLLADTPLGDDFSDFIYEAVARFYSDARGHLYVVTNPTYRDFFKVGMTSRSPAQRLAELNNEAVLGEFVLVQSWEVYDRYWLEKEAHRRLADSPRQKEFFHGRWREICEVVADVVKVDRILLEKAGLLEPHILISGG